MNKTLSVLFFALMVCLTGMAQNKNQAPPPRPDDGKMVQQRTNEMVKRYGLNKKQAAQLLALNKKYPHAGMGPGGPGGGQPPKDAKGKPKAGQQPPKNGQQPPKDAKGKQPPKAGQQPPKAGQQPPKAGQQPPKAGQQPPKNGQQPPQKNGQKPPQPPKGGQGPGGPGGPGHEPGGDMQAYNKALSKIMTAAQYKKYLADEKNRRPQPPKKK